MFIALYVFIDVHAVFELGFVGGDDPAVVRHFHDVGMGAAGEGDCGGDEEEQACFVHSDPESQRFNVETLFCQKHYEGQAKCKSEV